ncbi:hypothetical protein [Bacillus sp. 165]|uniref:hypothetical protein n=1 Tax=Bacillus sp. 165 TaxID=1529117 RepID=UPI001ADAA5EB|nr:hypothetical protein [Bacillus sp. 165]MBO9128401.1 hypothetical protein [Bacillus sp. 165]
MDQISKKRTSQYEKEVQSKRRGERNIDPMLQTIAEKLDIIEIGQRRLEAGQTRIETIHARLEAEVTRVEAELVRIEQRLIRLETEAAQIKEGQGEVQKAWKRVLALFTRKSGINTGQE